MSKLTTLVISKEKIVALCNLGSTRLRVKEYAVNLDGLEQVLTTIKSEFGNNFYIVFSDDLAYVSTLDLPEITKEELLEEKIAELLAGEVPENLNEAVWFLNSDKAGKKVSYAVLKQDWVAKILTLFKTLNSQILGIDVLSLKIAAVLNRQQGGEYVFLYKQGNHFLGYVKDGNVCFIDSFKEKFTLTEVTKFFEYLADRFQYHQKVIVDIGAFLSEELCESLAAAQINVQKKALEFQSLLTQESKWEKIFNCPFKFKKENGLTTVLPTSKRGIGKLTLLTIGLGIMGLIAFFSFKQNWLNKNKPVVPLVQKESTTSIPTPTKALVKADFRISVLNGNGKEGAATEVEAILDTEDYRVVETGNAENYDYEQTVIRAKSSIPSKFLDGIDKLLGKTYDVVVRYDLETANKMDVVIVVGAN